MPALDLHVELPDEVTVEEAKLSIAIRLFEEEKVRLGQGAQVAGLSYRDFIEELSKRGIPWVRTEWDEGYEREFASLSACRDRS